MMNGRFGIMLCMLKFYNNSSGFDLVLFLSEMNASKLIVTIISHLTLMHESQTQKL